MVDLRSVFHIQHMNKQGKITVLNTKEKLWGKINIKKFNCLVNRYGACIIYCYVGTCHIGTNIKLSIKIEHFI